MLRILRHFLAIGSSIGLIAAALAALAQDLPGNIASGRHTAESWCTRCHQIYLENLIAHTCCGFSARLAPTIRPAFQGRRFLAAGRTAPAHSPDEETRGRCMILASRAA